MMKFNIFKLKKMKKKSNFLINIYVYKFRAIQ